MDPATFLGNFPVKPLVDEEERTINNLRLSVEWLNQNLVYVFISGLRTGLIA
jgi:hypothetical protein